MTAEGDLCASTAMDEDDGPADENGPGNDSYAIWRVRATAEHPEVRLELLAHAPRLDYPVRYECEDWSLMEIRCDRCQEMKPLEGFRHQHRSRVHRRLVRALRGIQRPRGRGGCTCAVCLSNQRPAKNSVLEALQAGLIEIKLTYKMDITIPWDRKRRYSYDTSLVLQGQTSGLKSFGNDLWEKAAQEVREVGMCDMTSSEETDDEGDESGSVYSAAAEDVAVPSSSLSKRDR